MGHAGRHGHRVPEVLPAEIYHAAYHVCNSQCIAYVSHRISSMYLTAYCVCISKCIEIVSHSTSCKTYNTVYFIDICIYPIIYYLIYKKHSMQVHISSTWHIMYLSIRQHVMQHFFHKHFIVTFLPGL